MIRISLFIILLLINFTAWADDEGLCHGSFVNPITDICWSCLFPLSIGSASVVQSSLPDTTNPVLPVCVCQGHSGLPSPGLTISFWEPIALTDVTRHPFCMVNLGGMQFKFGDYFSEGYAENADSDRNSSFYHVHWYVYPVLYWLNLLTDFACHDSADFDIAYLTELDPTWNDEEDSFIINPEAFLFANPIAQAACSADSLSALVGSPLDQLFWCAGSQGSMYPLTGQVQEHVGGVAASTLLTERMDFKMHREFLIKDSSPDYPELCLPGHHPFLAKTRYRYQMTNPLPTTGSHGCFPFGRNTAIWEAGHEYPYKGEDFGFLIWRKRNCCAVVL